MLLARGCVFFFFRSPMANESINLTPAPSVARCLGYGPCVFRSASGGLELKVREFQRSRMVQFTNIKQGPNYWGYFISNRYLMIFGLVMWNKSPIVGTSIPTPRSHSPTKIMCLNKLQSGKTNRCCILCPSCAQLTFWNLTQLAHCKSKIMKSPSECQKKKCEGSTIEM